MAGTFDFSAGSTIVAEEDMFVSKKLVMRGTGTLLVRKKLVVENQIRWIQFTCDCELIIIPFCPTHWNIKMYIKISVKKKRSLILIALKTLKR